MGSCCHIACEQAHLCKFWKNFGSAATKRAGEDSKKNKARNLGLCHDKFPELTQVSPLTG